MGDNGIEVIATTMSESIKDWGKIERIKAIAALTLVEGPMSGETMTRYSDFLHATRPFS